MVELQPPPRRPCFPLGRKATVTGYGPPPMSELHLRHRVLDLPDDRVAEVLAAVGLVALHRRHDARHDERDEQDQRDVLDGALPDLARETAQLALHLPPPSKLTRAMLPRAR